MLWHSSARRLCGLPWTFAAGRRRGSAGLRKVPRGRGGRGSLVEVWRQEVVEKCGGNMEGDVARGSGGGKCGATGIWIQVD